MLLLIVTPDTYDTHIIPVLKVLPAYKLTNLIYVPLHPKRCFLVATPDTYDTHITIALKVLPAYKVTNLIYVPLHPKSCVLILTPDTYDTHITVMLKVLPAFKATKYMCLFIQNVVLIATPDTYDTHITLVLKVFSVTTQNRISSKQYTRFNSFLTGNIVRLSHNYQPLNAVEGKSVYGDKDAIHCVGRKQNSW
jgi:hypothetical protein